MTPQKILQNTAVIVVVVTFGMPGCIAEMRSDIASHEKRLGELETGIKEEREELRRVLEEASAVLRRNSADQGQQIESLQERVDALDGRFAEATNMTDAREGEHEKAHQHFEERLRDVARAAGMDLPVDERRVPQDKDDHYRVAERSFRAGQHTDARALFREYVRRYPKDSRADDAQYFLGKSYLQQGRPAAALGEFKQVIAKYRKGNVVDKTLYDMANAFYRVRACKDATTALEALLKNHRKSPLAKKARERLRKIKKASAAECAD